MKEEIFLTEETNQLKLVKNVDEFKEEFMKNEECKIVEWMSFKKTL
jgi:hypothetical protein